MLLRIWNPECTPAVSEQRTSTSKEAAGEGTQHLLSAGKCRQADVRVECHEIHEPQWPESKRQKRAVSVKTWRKQTLAQRQWGGNTAATAAALAGNSLVAPQRVNTDSP